MQYLKCIIIFYLRKTNLIEYCFVQSKVVQSCFHIITDIPYCAISVSSQYDSDNEYCVNMHLKV